MRADQKTVSTNPCPHLKIELNYSSKNSIIFTKKCDLFQEREDGRFVVATMVALPLKCASHTDTRADKESNGCT